MNRTSRPYIGAVLAAAVLTAALAGCGTTRNAIMATADPVRELKQEGISLTLRYLDDAALKRDFGTGSNPFLTQYYRLSFRRILVFELTLRNQSGAPVELEHSRCELDYGTKLREATVRFQLLNYWKGMGDEPRMLAEKEKLINRWVLPNRARVADGGTLFGYLIFMGNLPRTGEATVYVPVFQEGTSVNFQADYSF